jgi:hypothetical protein
MRDDEANLYGDRCKFKKVGETEFCKHHSEKQPLGVWGAEYSGKFHVLVEKLNAPAQEPKAPKAPKEPKAAKKSKAAAEVCELTEEAVEEAAPAPAPVADKPKAAKKSKVAAEVEEVADEAIEEPTPAPVPAPKKAAPVAAPEPEASDNEECEVEECEIDGKTYLRDNEGTIYDIESEEEVGKYNFKTKKWVKRA